MTVCLEPDWAVAAKEQAVRDAEARAQAEAARAAGLLEEPAEEAPAKPRRDERDEDDVEFGDED